MTKILGQIGKLTPNITTVVFLGAVVLIIIIERVVDAVDEWCKENRYQMVFNKLQNQLMNLGIISFVVFGIESFSGEYPVIAHALHAFEFTHIVILSIAVSFIVQSILLVHHSIHESKYMLVSLRQSSSELLREFYNIVQDPKSYRSKALLVLPSWTAVFHMLPSCRESIENKIMEQFFMKRHRLPSNFDFAKYVYVLFQKYLVQLGHVSTFGWLLVMFCVAVNYFRLMVIDPAVSTCNNEHHTDDHAATDDHSAADDGGHHRRLLHGLMQLVSRQLAAEATHTDDGFTCLDNYITSYALAAAAVLMIYIFCVYVVANVYYDRMIEICGRAFKTSFKPGKGGRLNYAECLKTLIPLEEHNAITHSVFSLSQKLDAFNGDSSSKSNFGSTFGDDDAVSNAIQEKASAFSVQSDVHEQHNQDEIALIRLYLKKKSDVAREIHDRIELKRKPFSVRFWRFLQEIREQYEDQFKEITDDSGAGIGKIFVGNVPGLFFLAVELAMFMQCFYAAVWATQLMPVALQSPTKAVWMTLLTLPVLINFFIMRHILVMAVMLTCFLSLDNELVVDVCKELIDESSTLCTLREKVIRKQGRVQEEKKVIVVCRMLKMHDRRHKGCLNKLEFRQFLGTHHMYLDHDQFRAIWHCIDANLNGSISWDEIFVTLFPDMEACVKRLILITDRLKSEALVEFKNSLSPVVRWSNEVKQWLGKPLSIPPATWQAFLKYKFSQYDRDGSGSIDKCEFEEMCRGMQVFQSGDRSVFNDFFRRMAILSSVITWNQFLLLVDPMVACDLDDSVIHSMRLDDDDSECGSIKDGDFLKDDAMFSIDALDIQVAPLSPKASVLSPSSHSATSGATGGTIKPNVRPNVATKSVGFKTESLDQEYSVTRNNSSRPKVVEIPIRDIDQMGNWENLNEDFVFTV